MMWRLTPDLHTHTQTQAHTNTGTHTHTQAHTHRSTHTQAHTQTQAHTHTNTGTHTQTNIHTHTHTHTHTLVSCRSFLFIAVVINTMTKGRLWEDPSLREVCRSSSRIWRLELK